MNIFQHVWCRVRCELIQSTSPTRISWRTNSNFLIFLKSPSYNDKTSLSLWIYSHPPLQFSFQLNLKKKKSVALGQVSPNFLYPVSKRKTSSSHNTNIQHSHHAVTHNLFFAFYCFLAEICNSTCTASYRNVPYTQCPFFIFNQTIVPSSHSLFFFLPAYTFIRWVVGFILHV